MLFLRKINPVFVKSNVATAGILYRQESKQLLALWKHIVWACLKQVYTPELLTAPCTSMTVAINEAAAEENFLERESRARAETSPSQILIKKNFNTEKILPVAILFTLFSATHLDCFHFNKLYCFWSPQAKVKTGPNTYNLDECYPDTLARKKWKIQATLRYTHFPF